MNEEKMIYSSMEHKDFFVRSLKRCRYQDVYHAALVYCLGIDRDTRDHVNDSNFAHSFCQCTLKIQYLAGIQLSKFPLFCPYAA